MNRVNHFEIHASEPEKAIAFYQDVFGWRFEKYPLPGMEYWGIYTGAEPEPAAINGGLMLRKGSPPAEGQAVNAFVCTMTVADIKDMAAKVEKAGGRQAVPISALAGMAWLAYFKDPDGNLFGLIQNDKEAK